MTDVSEQIETTTDSQAYSLGMDAGLSPDFVPCPFEPGSRAEMLWHSGRSDILYTSRPLPYSPVLA